MVRESEGRDATPSGAIRRQFDDIAAVYNPDRELPLVCSHLLGRRFRANRMPDGERARNRGGETWVHIAMVHLMLKRLKPT